MQRSGRLVGVVFWLVVLLSACQAPRETVEEGRVLFEDDFSAEGSGWDQVFGFEGETNYREGAYMIRVKRPGYRAWASPGKNFNDVQVEVDAEKQAGPPDSEYGIVCRVRDLGNFYVLAIRSDGLYSIGKVAEGRYSLLAPASPPDPSGAIQAGGALNHIRADCIGDTLTLYANGEKLLETRDGDFASGDAGLIAGGGEATDLDIRFDNFRVTEPAGR